MAYLSRQEYDRRRESAARKMEKNAEAAEAAGLSEAQISAIEEVCSIRHEIHANPTAAASLFCNSGSFESIWDCIDTANVENRIFEIIEDAGGLPDWHWRYSFLDAGGDEDSMEEMIATVGSEVNQWDFPDPDDYQDEILRRYSDHWIWELSDVIERWNDSIEKWLGEVDEMYGTSYRPTGALRVF